MDQRLPADPASDSQLADSPSSAILPGLKYDGLTDLADRPSMVRVLKRFDEADCIPLSVIVGDINGLRLINSVGGCSLGDTLIQSVARVIAAACCGRGVVGRWGGDEFLAALPGVGRGDAAFVCTQIKTRLQATGDLISSCVALGTSTRNSMDVPLSTVVADAESAAYQRKLLERASPRSSLIVALHTILSYKSHEIAGHSARMSALAAGIGKWIKLPDSALSSLDLLCHVHDIGELAIPDSVLQKRGPLTPHEWRLVRTHPELGCEIVESARELAPLGNSVLSHHECWDGSGYPRGIQGIKIPLIARITAIVDAYDVMTHDRPYRKAVSHEIALREVLRCSGSQFDPGLASVFARVVEGRA